MSSCSLGDLAIAVPTAGRQAGARGVSLLDEVCLLAIHGTLHLLGYEDESDEDRDRMQGAMSRAAATAGLAGGSDWTSLHHAGEASE